MRIRKANKYTTAFYQSLAGIICGLVFCVLPARADTGSPAAAERPPVPPPLARLQTALPATMPEIIALPVRHLKAVQDDDRLVFISDNSRFVITGGQLLDVWQGKVLGTLASVRKAATALDLKKLGLDVNTLNTVRLGSGAQEVIAFIDPLSPPSRALVKAARTLVKAYTFRFVIVPALGDASRLLAKAIVCASDKNKAFEASLDNSRVVSPLPKDCDLTSYNRTLLLAQLIPIEGVPTLIAPNGRLHKGVPEDLKRWLKDNAVSREGPPSKAATPTAAAPDPEPLGAPL